MENFNNFKMPFLVKVGCFISAFGYTNKLSIFKWFYNHCGWFNKRIKKQLNNFGPYGSIVFDAFYSDKPIDFKAIYNSLSDEQKAEWNKYKEKAIQKTIEENNITDEEEIVKLRESFEF